MTGISDVHREAKPRAACFRFWNTENSRRFRTVPWGRGDAVRCIARELAPGAADEVAFSPGHHHRCVRPMAGIEPEIDTGISHRQVGIGQIGAGLTVASMLRFAKAVEAFAEYRESQRAV